VVSLSWRDTPEVTNALLAKLNDRTRPVRATAVAVLAARTTPKITQTLLDEFADQAWATRVAGKMTWRDAPEVTQGLLERLGDQSGFVREMTEEVIAEHDAPEVLIYLAKEPKGLCG
jgi:HEAT repeat protein